jgi:DNA-binding NarL/FixJ family response regulator
MVIAKSMSCPTILLVDVSEDFHCVLTKNSSLRIISTAKGSSAIICLRRWKIDLLIGRWNLPDLRDGRMFEHVRAAKPSLPLVALVTGDDRNQEIAARNMGVTAVIDDDFSIDLICQIVYNILKPK